MLHLRDFSVGYSFSAMDSQDRICAHTSVVLNMFSGRVTLFFVKIIYKNVL